MDILKIVDVNFSELLNKTIIKIDGLKIHSSEITFHTSDGLKFVLYHDQDCCETVEVCDINGDEPDLLNYPILLAEESFKRDDKAGEEWTFYRLRTIKGSVDIRWHAEDTYYSSAVSFGIERP